VRLELAAAMASLSAANDRETLVFCNRIASLYSTQAAQSVLQFWGADKDKTLPYILPIFEKPKLVQRRRKL